MLSWDELQKRTEELKKKTAAGSPTVQKAIGTPTLENVSSYENQKQKKEQEVQKMQSVRKNNDYTEKAKQGGATRLSLGAFDINDLEEKALQNANAAAKKVYGVDLLPKDISGFMPTESSKNKSRLEYMTDQEIQDYSYFRSIDKNLADQYMNHLEWDLDRRMTEDVVSQVQQETKNNPLSSLVSNISASAGEPLGALAGLGTNIKNLVTGEDEAVNPYSRWFLPTNVEQATRNSFIGDSTGAEKFAKEAAIALGQFLPTLATGVISGGSSVVPAAISGLGSASGAIYDATKRGASAAEALGYGTVVGAADALSDKFTLGRLDEILQKPAGNTLTQILKNVGGNALKEGGEEALSEAIATAADRLILGENSNIANSIAAYKNQGMTDEEAFQKAMLDAAMNVGYAGLMGATVGGILSAGTAGLHGLSGNSMDGANIVAEEAQIDPATKAAAYGSAANRDIDITTQGTPLLLNAPTDSIYVDQRGRAMNTADYIERSLQYENNQNARNVFDIMSDPNKRMQYVKEKISKFQGEDYPDISAISEGLEEYIRAADTLGMNLKSVADIDSTAKKISDLFGIRSNRNMIQQLQDVRREILSNGRVSENTIDRIFGNLVDNTRLNIQSMDPEVRDVLKNSRIHISPEDAANIADFNDFRKSMFGKIGGISTKDGGIPIDTLYAELSEKYPEYFSPDIVIPSEQLEKIASVADDLKNKTKSFRDSVSRDVLDSTKKNFVSEIKKLEATIRAREIPKDPVYRVYNGVQRLVRQDQSAVKEEMPFGLRAEDLFGDSGLHENKSADIPVNANIASGEAEVNYSQPNPVDLPEVKELENELQNMDPVDIDEEIARSLKPLNNLTGYLNKDFFRMLEAVGGNSDRVKKWLDEKFKTPFDTASKKYVSGVLKESDKLYQLMQETGIKKESRESAAAQWYYEGYRLNEVGDKVTYTLHDLKLEFPDNWQNIKRVGDVCGELLKKYPDALNENFQKIYPDVEKNAWSEYHNLLKKANDAEEKAIEQREKIERLQKEAQLNPEKYADYQSASTSYQEMIQKASAYRKAARAKENDIVSGKIFEGKRLQTISGNYMPHYTKKERGIRRLLQLGESNMQIDPRLEGVSEYTKPKTKWASFMQHRQGGYYDADAIGNTLRYIQEAEYKLAFDPFIADARKTTKAIADATVNTRNANDFIRFLVNYTNQLAGKTSTGDRLIMNLFGSKGRNVLSALEWVNNRAKSNAVMANPRSAVAQFFNLPNAFGYIQNPSIWAQGIKMMSDSFLDKNGAQDLFDQSTFLRQRYDISKTLSKFETGLLQKPEAFANWMMTAGDEFSTRLIWATAYADGAKKGVSNPIVYADDIARKSVGGRGVGEAPIIQNSKTYKFIAPFTLEVANGLNVWSDAIGSKNVAGIAMMLMGNYIMNSAAREMFGSDVSMDLINAVIEGMEDAEEEKNSLEKIVSTAGRVSGELLSNIPLGAQLISYVFPDESTREQIFGEGDPTRFGTGNIGLTAITDVIGDIVSGQDFSESMLHAGLTFGLPYGGRATERGISALQDFGYLPEVTISTEDGIQTKQNAAPGSYTANGRLRFPIEETPQNLILDAAFGPYATERGKDYIEGGLKLFSEKQTESYDNLIESGMKNTSAFDTIKNISAYDKNAEKKSYLNRADLPDDQKAILYYDVIANDNEKAIFDYLGNKDVDIASVYNVVMNISSADNIMQKRKAISSSTLSNSEKEYVFFHMVSQSDKDRERLKAYKDAGMDIDDYVHFYNQYSLYKSEGGSVKERYVAWLYEQGLTAAQMETIVTGFGWKW